MKILSIEEELILEKNFVWVFADRRSGTTWLSKELLSKDTKFLDEPLIGVHLGLFPGSTIENKRTIDIQKERTDYFFSEHHQDSWIYFLRKLILNRIHNQFEDLSSKIIIKEPSGSVGADIIAKCFPKSRIIVMLRDGRDILDSKIDGLTPQGWEAVEKKGLLEPITEKNRLRYIKKYSKNWVHLVQTLKETFKKHPKELRYQLRYEELLKNTLNELKKLYQFLSIDAKEEDLKEIINRYSFEKIPKNQKGKGKFRRFATPGMWRENFNEEEKRLIEKIMGETLRDLGY